MPRPIFKECVVSGYIAVFRDTNNGVWVQGLNYDDALISDGDYVSPQLYKIPIVLRPDEKIDRVYHCEDMFSIYTMKKRLFIAELKRSTTKDFESPNLIRPIFCTTMTTYRLLFIEMEPFT